MCNIKEPGELSRFFFDFPLPKNKGSPMLIKPRKQVTPKTIKWASLLQEGLKFHSGGAAKF